MLAKGHGFDSHHRLFIPLQISYSLHLACNEKIRGFDPHHWLFCFFFSFQQYTRTSFVHKYATDSLYKAWSRRSF